MAAERKARAKKTHHSARNRVLGTSGVMRYSQPRMYKKRAIYRLKKTGGEKKVVKRSTDRKITKDIGGEKNGGKRVVLVNRKPRFYPTEDNPKRLPTRQKPFKKHERKLRKTITPGTVLILLAGRHKGKRVVFLKQLASGLLLVTGPYHLNGCPLRRIDQNYVIATKTKVDIKTVKLPERLTDDFFRRQKAKKTKHQEGEIFEEKKEEYTVSEERKEDQVTVDKQILEVIRSHPDKKMLFGYLGAMFSLSNHQFPHEMKF
ncbi:large ribosomal subunit protein eL6-like [Tubulanus polymorphus]|uniref:large ribosomal subunit protein eL6-like n=1 Tax=Tubulanus polymorphus TaxID=672921 RepID=UPI003DA6C00A